MKIYKKIKNRNKAFSLIETLVAVMIFSVAIMAVMAVLSSNIASINNMKKKTTAMYLAQEGVEYVRNLRDTYVISDSTSASNGWDQFIINTSMCLDKGCNLYDLSGSNSSLTGIEINYLDGFDRIIKINKDASGNYYNISSIVSWSQIGSTKSVTLSETLFKWIQ